MTVPFHPADNVLLSAAVRCPYFQESLLSFLLRASNQNNYPKKPAEFFFSALSFDLHAAYKRICLQHQIISIQPDIKVCFLVAQMSFYIYIVYTRTAYITIFSTNFTYNKQSFGKNWYSAKSKTISDPPCPIRTSTWFSRRFLSSPK